MAEKIICPHCRFCGDAVEERKNKKQVVQICPQCGNPIRLKYKPKGKGKTEVKQHG